MLTFDSFARVWFLTWTTYGTWLPGDARGFVSPKFEGDQPEHRHNVPGTEYDQGRPELRAMAKAKLIGGPVFLTREQAVIVQTQFEETATYRGSTIVAGAVMSNHVHLLVGVPDDPEPFELLRDFKSYASRALNHKFAKPVSGTWWTEQGSTRKVKDQDHFENTKSYVHRQNDPLIAWRFVAPVSCPL